MGFWWENYTKPKPLYRKQGAWVRGCASVLGYSVGGVLIFSSGMRGGMVGFLIASGICFVVQVLWRLLLRYSGNIQPASEVVDDSVRNDAAAYRAWLSQREAERARNELESQAEKQRQELERRAKRAAAAAAETKAAKDLTDAQEWRKIQSANAAAVAAEAQEAKKLADVQAAKKLADGQEWRKIQAAKSAASKPKPRPRTAEEEHAAQARRDKKLLEEWRAKRAREEKDGH
jgi:hypothetical protein